MATAASPWAAATGPWVCTCSLSRLPDCTPPPKRQVYSVNQAETEPEGFGLLKTPPPPAPPSGMQEVFSSKEISPKGTPQGCPRAPLSHCPRRQQSGHWAEANGQGTHSGQYMTTAHSSIPHDDRALPRSQAHAQHGTCVS